MRSLLLALVIGFTGCATSRKVEFAAIEAIRPGMTKDQVTERLGQPDHRQHREDKSEAWVWSHATPFKTDVASLIFYRDQVISVPGELPPGTPAIVQQDHINRRIAALDAAAQQEEAKLQHAAGKDPNAELERVASMERYRKEEVESLQRAQLAAGKVEIEARKNAPQRRVAPKPNKGYSIYLKSSGDYIGLVNQLSADHVFDDGTTRPGLEIWFEDGSTGWIPLKTAEHVYWFERP